MKKLLVSMCWWYWRRRLSPSEDVVEITGWRSAVVHNQITGTTGDVVWRWFWEWNYLGPFDLRED